MSLTARIIAVLRSKVDRPTLPTGDAEAERRLARSLGPARLLQVPGLSGYVAARTQFYDQALLRACESGASQVVIVAAGYDGRAIRFRQPGVRFFELDHPVTQADKRARLDQLSVEAGDVRFVPVDLGQDSVADALTAAGHESAGVTHFMCEGLTPYLPVGDVSGLFRVLRQRAGPGSSLAVDFTDSGDSAVNRVRVGLVRVGVGLLGERMVTLLTPDEAGDLLQSTGWTDVTLSAPGSGLPGIFALARV